MITIASVSQLNREQLRQIGELYRGAGWWDEAPNETEQISRMIAGSYCFIVAIAEGFIVGMGRCISDGVSDAYVQDVTVHKNYRKQGIATNIIRTLISRSIADGLHWIGVIAERGTHPLYQKIGFKPLEASLPLVIRLDGV